MSKTIPLVLTRRNQINKSNVFRLMFSEAVTIPENTYINLHSCNIYNCFRNVLARYGNNTFSITWIDNQTYNFSIQDGGYSIDDIGSYIESVCFNTNLFWYSGTSIIYPFSIKSNPTSYGAQIICIPLPTTAEVTASNGSIKKPTGANWNFISTKRTATLTLVNPLSIMLGYKNADGSVQTLFPPSQQSSVYSINSPSAPDMKSVESIIIKCNFLNNLLLGSDMCDTLAVVANNVGFGDLKEFVSGYRRDISVSPRTYQYLDLILFDNEYRALDGNFLIDSDISFSLDITFPKK